MNHLGKCLNDIPIDKIYEGMRVAFALSRNNIKALGKILCVRKNIFKVCYIPTEPSHVHASIVSNKSSNTLIIELDNGAIYLAAHPQPRLETMFYVEESK